MKTAVIILAIVALASAVPTATKLNFRNLYKEPIAAPKASKPGRIIGGQEATPHSIKFQAFLTVRDNSGGWYCGGSLISENYVLTAGHCGDGGIQAEIVLGAHSITQDENTQVVVTSRDITVHENYDGNEIINDISVIRLPSAVQLTDAIGIVALPSSSAANNDFAGDTARVSGWGLTSGDSNQLPSNLRFVDVQVISQRQCEQTFGSLHSSVLCTSGSQNTGTCSGDSGGPLVDNGIQIGVVSFGVRNCPRGYPSGYARLTEFPTWISRHTDVNLV